MSAHLADVVVVVIRCDIISLALRRSAVPRCCERRASQRGPFTGVPSTESKQLINYISYRPLIYIYKQSSVFTSGDLTSSVSSKIADMYFSICLYKTLFYLHPIITYPMITVKRCRI